MLGRLLKNEIKSYRFSFGIMFLAGFIFTIFMKIVCMLPYQYGLREMIQVLGFYGYYYIILLIGAAAQVLVIVRFYSTMIGDRGYLTWTLPATSATHIWAKLIGGMLWKVLAFIVMFVFLGIFLVGNYWVVWNDFKEGFEAGSGFSFQTFGEQLAQIWEPEYSIPIIIGVLAVLVWAVATTLLIYMCIAIGQLFGKWRLLASIGCYFLIIIALQIVAVIGIVLVAIGDSVSSNNTVFYNCDDVTIVSVIFGIVLLVGIAASAVQFAITNFIFKKHLNLE